MIKQDYLIRMILEIITLIANALLNKQKIRPQSWVEYDCLTRQILEVPSDQLKDLSPEEIIGRYEGDTNRMGKIELAAMTLLKISDELGDEHLLLKSRLKQNVKRVEYSLRRAKSARQSLAQVLPCRFKWYNLSPPYREAPTTDI